MLEEYGNFWEIMADYRCITTNGILRKNGNAIMGKGIALEARRRCPDLEITLGKLIKMYGNHVFRLGNGLISFPTKWHWREDSDIELIKRSAQELVFLLKNDPAKRVLLTRPGCGSGNLHWSGVKPFIQNILSDNKFVIIDNGDIYNQYQKKVTKYDKM